MITGANFGETRNLQNAVHFHGVQQRSNNLYVGLPGQDPERGTNDEDRAYVCQMCGKRFMTRGHLKTHLMIHTGERPFVCEAEGCGKTFARKERLEVHRRSHVRDTILPSRLERCLISVWHVEKDLLSEPTSGSISRFTKERASLHQYQMSLSNQQRRTYRRGKRNLTHRKQILRWLMIYETWILSQAFR